MRKPLSGSKIRDMNVRAERLDRKAQRIAVKVGKALLGDDSRNVPGTLDLRKRVRTAARNRYPQDHTVASIVDLAQLRRKAFEAVVASSRNGGHLITLREATDTVDRVIDPEVTAAFTALRQRAVDALLPRPGSPTWRLLKTTLEKQCPILDLDECPLTKQANQLIQRRFEKAINFGKITADLLDDEGTLEELAREVVKDFVAERVSASEAVQALDLGNREKASLLLLVARDNIPAQLVESLGESYLRLRDDLAALKGPLSADRVEEIVRAIRETLSVNLDVISGQIFKSGELPMSQSILRFLLTPGGAHQAAALHGLVAPPDGLLRGIGAGAGWYKQESTGSRAAGRTHVDAATVSARAAVDRPVHPASPNRIADRTDLTIRSLVGVLPELVPELGQIADIDAGAGPSDESICSLRNLGIPFPAPRRLERSDTQLSELNMKRAPLSEATLKEVCNRLDSYIQRNQGDSDHRALARGFAHHLRSEPRRIEVQSAALGQNRNINCYYIGDEQLLEPDQRALTRRLIEFCTPANGPPDREMLKGISLMADPRVLDCIYSGCMDPERPELAVLGGRLEGATERTNYRLSRDAHGQVRLDVSESFTPFFLAPAGSQAPGKVSLSPSKSILRTRVGMSFQPGSFRSNIDNIDVEYRLVRGKHIAGEGPWIISKQS